MGCSSYVRVPDPRNPTSILSLQFKYGFLREIDYAVGEEIQWEKNELPLEADTHADALVPAWTVDGDRHFALRIDRNRINGAVSEISEEDADRLLEEQFEQTTRHVWKK